MWGGIVGLIIQLIAGGVGGNIAGSALKQYDLGAVGNTIAGIIGGGVGAQIVGALVGGGGSCRCGNGWPRYRLDYRSDRFRRGRRRHPDGNRWADQAGHGRTKGDLSHSAVLAREVLTLVRGSTIAAVG